MGCIICTESFRSFRWDISINTCSTSLLSPRKQQHVLRKIEKNRFSVDVAKWANKWLRLDPTRLPRQAYDVHARPNEGYVSNSHSTRSSLCQTWVLYTFSVRTSSPRKSGREYSGIIALVFRNCLARGNSLKLCFVQLSMILILPWPAERIRMFLWLMCKARYGPFQNSLHQKGLQRHLRRAPAARANNLRLSSRMTYSSRWRFARVYACLTAYLHSILDCFVLELPYLPRAKWLHRKYSRWKELRGRPWRNIISHLLSLHVTKISSG